MIAFRNVLIFRQYKYNDVLQERTKLILEIWFLTDNVASSENDHFENKILKCISSDCFEVEISERPKRIGIETSKNKVT
jgi:hypothetical protein